MFNKNAPRHLSFADSSDELSVNGSFCVGGCQHITQAVDITEVKTKLNATGLASHCILCMSNELTSPASEIHKVDKVTGNNVNNALWLCLKCGTQLCGRVKNKHALNHFTGSYSESHALSMNTQNYKIWCYKCHKYVSPNLQKNILECIELVEKLAQQPPVEALSVEDQMIATFDSTRPSLSSVSSSVLSSNGDLAIPLPIIPAAPLIPGKVENVGDDFESMTTASNIDNFDSLGAYIASSGRRFENINKKKAFMYRKQILEITLAFDAEITDEQVLGTADEKKF